MARVWTTAMAAKRGNELHELAAQLIRLGVRLPQGHKTLNMYVNDAIGYKMVPEQILFYSINAYGCADAICFRRNVLRIFDLKTGDADFNFRQLEIYAAFFCLEYNHRPFDIEIDLRIYHRDNMHQLRGDPDAIMHIMDKIKVFDKHINQMRMEAML